jgi:hypothetical protein
MRKGYRPYLPEQALLLPPNLKDWLPENHLAYFVSDVVDELDLSAIHAVYEKDPRGQPPYDPRISPRRLWRWRMVQKLDRESRVKMDERLPVKPLCSPQRSRDRSAHLQDRRANLPHQLLACDTEVSLTLRSIRSLTRLVDNNNSAYRPVAPVAGWRPCFHHDFPLR